MKELDRNLVYKNVVSTITPKLEKGSRHITSTNNGVIVQHRNDKKALVEIRNVTNVNVTLGLTVVLTVPVSGEGYSIDIPLLSKEKIIDVSLLSDKELYVKLPEKIASFINNNSDVVENTGIDRFCYNLTECDFPLMGKFNQMHIPLLKWFNSVVLTGTSDNISFYIYNGNRLELLGDKLLFDEVNEHVEMIVHPVDSIPTHKAWFAETVRDPMDLLLVLADLQNLLDDVTVGGGSNNLIRNYIGKNGRVVSINPSFTGAIVTSHKGIENFATINNELASAMECVRAVEYVRSALFD
nr:MAG TPA: hypothetical protein [Caudoviricetes sp.]